MYLGRDRIPTCLFSVPLWGPRYIKGDNWLTTIVLSIIDCVLRHSGRPNRSFAAAETYRGKKDCGLVAMFSVTEEIWHRRKVVWHANYCFWCVCSHTAGVIQNEGMSHLWVLISARDVNGTEPVFFFFFVLFIVSNAAWMFVYLHHHWQRWWMLVCYVFRQ